MNSMTKHKLFAVAIALLLCLALLAIPAVASNHGGGGGSSGGSHGGKSASKKVSKEATRSFKEATAAVTAAEKVAKSASDKAPSVELSRPGQAVIAQQGQAPTSDKGVSEADRARLDNTNVNKKAPVPTNLK